MAKDDNSLKGQADAINEEEKHLNRLQGMKDSLLFIEASVWDGGSEVADFLRGCIRYCTSIEGRSELIYSSDRALRKSAAEDRIAGDPAVARGVPPCRQAVELGLSQQEYENQVGHNIVLRIELKKARRDAMNDIASLIRRSDWDNGELIAAYIDGAASNDTMDARADCAIDRIMGAKA